MNDKLLFLLNNTEYKIIEEPIKILDKHRDLFSMSVMDGDNKKIFVTFIKLGNKSNNKVEFNITNTNLFDEIYIKCILDILDNTIGQVGNIDYKYEDNQRIYFDIKYYNDIISDIFNTLVELYPDKLNINFDKKTKLYNIETNNITLLVTLEKTVAELMEKIKTFHFNINSITFRLDDKNNYIIEVISSKKINISDIRWSVTRTYSDANLHIFNTTLLVYIRYKTKDSFLHNIKKLFSI